MFWTHSKAAFWILIALLLLSLSILIFMQMQSRQAERRYAEIFKRSVQASDEIDRLKSLAFSDYLTGLANRILLEKRVQDAFASSLDNTRYLVAFIDLDNFKEINDTFGHGIGDAVLRKVAIRLKRAMRPTDIVARLGGDEFIIFAEIGCSSDEEAIIRKIGEIFFSPIALNEQRIVIEASVGNAIFPDDGMSLERLLAAADQNMYRQKRSKQLSLSL